MEELVRQVLLFGWDILKIVLAVKAAWIAYIIYGIHKGFIHYSA